MASSMFFTSNLVGFSSKPKRANSVIRSSLESRREFLLEPGTAIVLKVTAASSQSVVPVDAKIAVESEVPSNQTYDIDEWIKKEIGSPAFQSVFIDNFSTVFNELKPIGPFLSTQTNNPFLKGLFTCIESLSNLAARGWMVYMISRINKRPSVTPNASTDAAAAAAAAAAGGGGGERDTVAAAAAAAGGGGERDTVAAAAAGGGGGGSTDVEDTAEGGDSEIGGSTVDGGA